MDTATKLFKEIQNFFKANADPKIVKKYSRFFRDNYYSHGVDPKKLTPQLDKWYNETETEFKISDYKKLFELNFSTGIHEDIWVVNSFLSRMDRYYSKTLFRQIKSWIGKYYINWAQVDSICTGTLYKFILNDVVTHADLNQWHTHKNKWVRRCVPVTTVYVFYKQKKIQSVLKVGNLLINDPVREVGQGVGWMLRDAWKVYPEKIEKLLIKHVKTGNRTAYQYTCEKMDKEYRKRFRRPKLS